MQKLRELALAGAGLADEDQREPRESGVLVAGDLVTLPAPFFDTACPARWKQALARIAAAEWGTLVPGHGPPMSRATFARWNLAFDALLACAASEEPAAVCVEGWIREAGDLVEPAHGRLVRGMGEYYVTSHLRSAEKTAQLCGGDSPHARATRRSRVPQGSARRRCAPSASTG